MLWRVGLSPWCAGLHCDQLPYSLYYPRNTYPGANLVTRPALVLTAAFSLNGLLWARSSSFGTPPSSSCDRKVQNWRIQLVCSFCRLFDDCKSKLWPSLIFIVACDEWNVTHRSAHVMGCCSHQSTAATTQHTV